MGHIRFARVLAALVLLGLAGCRTGGNRVVHVTAEEWRMMPDRPAVAAGKVTLELTNRGQLAHELVVLKTDLAPTALKALASDPTKVDEEASAANVGEIEELDPGRTGSGTVDLQPGRYVLLCNIPGHYQQGMAAALEVT
jgi:uncharacterized cupredoxin-like copper-binding protein